jgi:hypothetical protein
VTIHLKAGVEPTPNALCKSNMLHTVESVQHNCDAVNQLSSTFRELSIPDPYSRNECFGFDHHLLAGRLCLFPNKIISFINHEIFHICAGE